MSDSETESLVWHLKYQTLIDSDSDEDEALESVDAEDVAGCEESDGHGEMPASGWSVSLDHPFRKDFVPLPDGDEIYVSSDDTDEPGDVEQEEEEKEDDCLCRRCGDEGVDGPRVCCASFNLPEEELCITDSKVLKHAFEYPWFMETLSITVDRQKRRPNREDIEEFNKLMRHTAYVFAKDELHLRGHQRTKLPDCLVIWVRRLFPSPSGNYVGFIS